MAIRGEDNRSIVTNFNVDGIDAVVGIDTPTPALEERNSNSEVVTNVGTGNLISPYHVLTAGHVIFREPEVKVRLGQNAADLDSRTRTPLSSGNFDASGTDLSYPVPGYNGGTGENDLGLITLNESIGESSQYIGLVTFVDPQDADNLEVTTAGFPGVVEVGDFATNEDGSLNIEDSISKNAQFLITDENNAPSEFLQSRTGSEFYISDAVKLFTATGTIDSVDSEGRFSLDETLDGESGQSGSGYWTYLEGDSEPRVLGVYSEGGDNLAGGLLDDNFGALISTEAYENIVAEMQPLLDDSNLSGNALPENAIVGSNQSDEIEGTYRKERILGDVGQDIISGGDADDRLEGGFGNDNLDGGKGNDRLQGDNDNDYLDGGEGNIDVAVFSEEYTTENYDYSISEDGAEITISHIGGTRNDGVDTLKNIEWALFENGAQEIDSLALTETTGSAPRIIPLPLVDGIKETEYTEVEDITPNPDPFDNDPPTPPNVTLTAPVSMLDGDIDYTLNISPYYPDTKYNVLYTIDTSGSMNAEELQAVKDAYTELTNYYINLGLAENINFGVVSFGRYATIQNNSRGSQDLTASEAIAAIQSLTTDTAIGTNYADALNQGAEFLLSSPLRPRSAFRPERTTSINYFFSDGRHTSNLLSSDFTSRTFESNLSRRFSNVQAFGLYDPAAPGTINEGNLDFVDSNEAVIIEEVNNLSTELLSSGLASDVESVNILVDSEIVETLTPDMLTDSPLGLTYEGSIEELDVSIDAENIVTAEVIFTPESNLATTTVEHTVTTGESEAVDSQGNPIDQTGNDTGNDDPFERELSGSDGDDEITLSYSDRGANGGAGGDYILGNNRDNRLNGGDGDDTIFGHGGNDTIVPGAGDNQVNGGDGIDTVVYGDIVYQDNDGINLSRAANSVNYNFSDLLSDIEFIQFADVRLSATTLEITPTIEIVSSDSNLTVVEGKLAQVSFELDTPAPVDVILDYSTSDRNANAGDDYVGTSGMLTIRAGETMGLVTIETLEDEIYDESNESFALNLTGLTGATFSNQLTELEIGIVIENLEPALTLNGTPDPDLLEGGNNDDLILGKAGNDTLNGNAGNDTIRGNGDHDTIVGGDDDDLLWGHGGDDKLIGGGGNDRVFVQSDSNIALTDTQVTGDGSDTLSSIEAANLYGNNDNNLINASNANKIKTFIQGHGGNDTLRGSALNDGIQGNSGDDTLVGNDGNDHLIGGAGDDFLQGDAGNDTLSGGGGNDVFTLKSAAGADVITDFRDGIDLFRLANSLAFADLGLSDNVAGDAALIRDLSNANQLLATVNGVSATDLTAADFV